MEIEYANIQSECESLQRADNNIRQENQKLRKEIQSLQDTIKSQQAKIDLVDWKNTLFGSEKEIYETPKRNSNSGFEKPKTEHPSFNKIKTEVSHKLSSGRRSPLIKASGGKAESKLISEVSKKIIEENEGYMKDLR